MTKDLPSFKGNYAGVRGSSDSSISLGGATWPSYLEKAMAVANQESKSGFGNYAGIEGHNGGVNSIYLAGKGVEIVDGAGVVQAVEEKKPMIVGTQSTRPAALSGDRDKMSDYQKQLADGYYESHAYYVKGIKGEMIVLGNPWGRRNRMFWLLRKILISISMAEKFWRFHEPHPLLTNVMCNSRHSSTYWLFSPFLNFT